MAHDKKQGFISGSLLSLLFVFLLTGLSLGKELAAAVHESKQNVQAIRADLAFEENLIRLDLGREFVQFEEGPYRVVHRQDGKGRRLELLDAGRVKEAVWLNGTASY